VKPGDNLSTFFGKLSATLGKLADEKLENLLYLSSLPEFCKNLLIGLLTGDRKITD